MADAGLLICVGFDFVDDGGNLRNHVVHIFKHGAFGGAQGTGFINMLDDLLVEQFDVVKKLADSLKLLAGGVDHAGDFGLNSGSALGGGGDLFKSAGSAVISRTETRYFPRNPGFFGAIPTQSAYVISAAALYAEP